MTSVSHLCGAMLAAAITGHAGATEVTLSVVNIAQVRVFGVAYGNYLAGDFDLVVVPSTSLPGSAAPWPTGLSCTDHSTITTRRSSDPQLHMLQIAKQVQAIDAMPARITITDDPTRQAQSGRCSLVAIQL